MKVIGITGKTGAGKSTVIEYLKHKGYLCLIEDEIATNIRESESFQKILFKKFGHKMSAKDLRCEIAKDISILSFLNDNLHPKVFEYVQSIIENNNDKDYIFIESAIPHQAKFNEICNEVWAIDCDANIRLNRVMKSRDISQNDFELLDKKQSFNKVKNLIIIENNSSQVDLIKKIDNLLNR